MPLPPLDIVADTPVSYAVPGAATCAECVEDLCRLVARGAPVAVALTADGQATPALLKKLASLGAGPEVVPQLKRLPDGKAATLLHISHAVTDGVGSVVALSSTTASGNCWRAFASPCGTPRDRPPAGRDPPNGPTGPATRPGDRTGPDDRRVRVDRGRSRPRRRPERQP